MIISAWFQRIWVCLENQVFRFTRTFLILGILLLCFGLGGMSPAYAGIDDDRYDGSIFTLYASNGALVPPKVDLATSLQKHRPALLMFYVDDSRECKQNALILSQLQAFYRNTVSIIPISVDSLPSDVTYTTEQAPYYYNGSFVPQFILFDQTGKVELNTIGEIPYEPIDDALRSLFDLPDRPEDFVLERPKYSPSPSADRTFWTAPVRALEKP
jgi:hypothetical protein